MFLVLQLELQAVPKFIDGLLFWFEDVLLKLSLYATVSLWSLAIISTSLRQTFVAHLVSATILQLGILQAKLKLIDSNEEILITAG
jgi:hypothetical protein